MKFYLTTPIFYVNAAPTIGSVYPVIQADIVARWHRLLGHETFFLTGLDENSIKTVKAAEENNMSPKEYTDKMASVWTSTFSKLNISNDDFIRTTEERHEDNVTEFFSRVNPNDIYKGMYEGLYCTGCEAYFTESDLVDGKCPDHKTVPKFIKEENYFFALSRYQKIILDYIKDNPEFIQPLSRKSEIISFVKSGLKDVSISRPSTGWGIKLPTDKAQSFWVWFDALVNYMLPNPKKWWPADLHVVGKDIIRFHCVLWPAMLMSAGYSLPKRVFAHGFFTIDGQKISKSIGNVIDPLYIVEKYGNDALRYYLIRGLPYGEDGDFSESSLVDRFNNELVANYGNLFYRVTYFIEKYYSGMCPEAADVDKVILKDKVERTMEILNKSIENVNLHTALDAIMHLSGDANKYFQEAEPWKDPHGEKAKKATFVAVNMLAAISTLLLPFIPESANKALKDLGLAELTKGHIKNNIGKQIEAGHRIKSEILYKSLSSKNE